MIQAALAQAGAAPSGKSTEEIRAIAQTAAPPTSANRGLKIMVAILVVLLLLLVAAGGVGFWYLTRGQESVADPETPTFDPEAAALAITTSAGGALFVLVEVNGEVSRGICAAFAVRPDLLGTTAQCVNQIQEGRARGASYVAVPNGGGDQRLQISQMWHHPSYAPGQPSADVGIVQIAGAAAAQTPLASMEELAALQEGAPLFLFSFTGDLADVSAPVGALSRGQLLAASSFDGAAPSFQNTQALSHDAPRTGPGARGSPLFDAQGHVVGIETGTGAVRIDLLASLLAGMRR
jgi:hypothetical protein